MSNPIYLDYNATTPVDGAVLDAMLPYFSSNFGNASSKSHTYGWYADAAIKKSRTSISELIGVSKDSIHFTSGATESLNLGLRGLALALSVKGRHIVTTASEHAAVHETCKVLARSGFEVSFVELERDGSLQIDKVVSAIRPDTILVSVIWANNETGVVNPIGDLSSYLAGRDILLLSDGTQTIGKMPVDASIVDIFCASSHKFYGPKGVGLIALSDRAKGLIPQITGGGQESGLRGGTSNTPGIVGMGKAAEIVSELGDDQYQKMQFLRDILETSLKKEIDELVINGSSTKRLVQTCNLRIPSLRSDKLIRALRGLAISPGSACSSGSSEPSRVLKAMGLSDQEALSSIRISLGRFTTEEEILSTIEQLLDAVRKSKS